MKETKNVPQLRFSAFDDEWEEKNFSEITYISATKNKSNLPLESYSITNENGFIPQDEQFENGGTMKDADKRMYWIVPPKSFGYNPARINVGSIGYYDGKKDVIVSSLYEIFKMTENCDDAFFWQWFKSDNLQKQVLKLQEGGVRLYFYYDKLCMGEIKIPSKGEQQKIGSLLSNLDSLIQAKTKKLESHKAVKKSLLQKCFPKAGEKVPEMRFAGFSGDWEEKKLGEIANIYDGTHQTPKYQSTGVKFLSVENIKNLETEKYISTADFVKDFKLYPQKGDILMTRIGDIGTTNIYLSTEPIAFYVSLALLKPTNIDSLFLNYVIQSSFVQNELSLHTLHTAIPKKINKNEISLVKLLVPSSKSEQQKIGQFFSKYDSFISAQQKEIDKLKDIKKSLLQKMFV
ncbi:MAG: restriction endonuclease subunit S [Spirochaetales bacterium]|nr:restriction endonuclease subunit S [Spirochaetales bacterium]MDY5915297.1 restriction endonuclease subunit S [Treponema sp.]